MRQCALLALILSAAFLDGPLRAEEPLTGGPPPPTTTASPAAKDAIPGGWSSVPAPPDASPIDGANGGPTGYLASPIDRIFNRNTYPKVDVTGFFQADIGWVHQSAKNRAAVGDAEDGADFRRARLAAVGDVWENVGYYLEFDFGFPGRPSFMDVWLEVRDVFDGVNIRVGQYRQPIGMDAMTSVRELSLIERSLTFAFLPFRQVGVMAHGTARDEAMTWAASVFRFPTDQFGNNVGDSGGYGLATRITGLVVEDRDDRLFHLGGAFSFADPSRNMLQYRNQPEAFIAETGGAALAPAGNPEILPFFVDTGPLAVDHYSLFGAEAAARSGSWYAQSELFVNHVRLMRDDTAVFTGGYAQTGYFLTGEVLPYDRKNGVFGRVRPRHPFDRSGGRGAWEVNVRWSQLNLNDAGVRGGRLNDLTFGVNWYLNPYVKFQLNYIRAFLNSPVNGHSRAGIALLRAQLDF